MMTLILRLVCCLLIVLLPLSNPLPSSAELLQKDGQQSGSCPQPTGGKVEKQGLLGAGESAAAWKSFVQGKLERDRHNLQGAIEQFAKALGQKGDWPLARALGALSQFELGRADWARREAQPILTLQPATADDWLARGIGFYVFKQHTEAVRDLSQAIERAPQYALAYEIRGKARAALSDRDCAVQDLVKAILIEPQSLPVYGTLLYTKPANSTAFDQFTALIRRAPDNPWLYAYRAQTQQPRTSQIEDYTKAIALAPREWRLLKMRGDLLSYTSGPDTKARAKSDWTKALELVGVAVKTDPQSDWLYRQRASLKFALGDVKGAGDDWAKVVSLNPSSDAYHDRSYFRRYSLNDLKGALDDANKSIELSPRDDKAYIYRAGLRESRDTEGMIQDYAKALELNPSSENYMSRASFRRYTTKNLKAALEDVSKAIELEPTYDYNYGYRADLRADLADRDGALQDLNKVVSLQPTPANYRRRASFKKDKLNDLNGALADATKAVDIAPAEDEGYTYRAEIRLKLKDTEGAKQDYDEIIRRHPTPENYRKRASFSRYSLNDLQAALADVTQAMQLAPNDPSHYEARADLRLALQDKEGALKEYAQLIKVQPVAASYLSRATFRSGYQIGDVAGAVEDATKAIELAPNQDDAYRLRAGWRANLKDNEGALKDYNKAVQLNPSVDNYKNLATFKADTLKNFEGALDDATKCIQAYPRDASLLTFRAKLKVKAQDIPSALQDMEQYVRMVATASGYWDRASFKKYELKDLKGAIEDTTRAIELNPGYDWYYRNRAELKIELNDSDGALEDYSKAVEIQPNGSNYETRAEFRKNKLSDLYGALQDYSKAYELSPSPSLQLKMAGIRARQGDMDSALKDALAAIRKNPDDYWTYSAIEEFGLTGKEDYTQRSQKVAATYSRLLEMAPDLSQLYARRAGARSSSQDYAGALQDYDRAIAADPKNLNLYFNRIDMKVYLKDPRGALQDYAEIIRMSPTSENYQKRANFRKNQFQDLQGALEDANQAVRLLPGNPDVYGFRAGFKRELKDLDGALQDYSQAIALQPKGTGTDYYQIRGALRIEMKDFAGAMQDYTKSIERNPSDSWAYIRRAELREQQGEVEGVIKDYTKAIEFQPKYGRLYFKRAQMREKKGDLRAAIADCTRALQVEPDNYDCKNYLGELRKKDRAASRTGSGPRTILVAADGSGDYTSIAQALKEAFAGDTLKIEPGTYVEPDFSIEVSVTLLGNSADPRKVLVDMTPKDEFTKSMRASRGPAITFGWDSKEPRRVKIGGMTIRGGDFSTYNEDLTLENVHFLGYAKRTDKGELIEGIRVGGNKPVLIKNCVVSGWGMGLGINNAQNVKLEHNLIQDNDIGLDILGSEVALENNTIVRNTSAESRKYGNSGSGVYIGVYADAYSPGREVGSKVTLYNNIVAFNSKGLVVRKSETRIEHNNVYGNPEGNYLDVTPSITNISIDPLFVDDMRGDFRLRPGSPLLSKGTGGTYIGAFGQGQR